MAGGAELAVETPQLKGFNFVGGITLSPEFSALLLGLVIYTSAFIAEVVRSGIQAVGRGQWEAADALGLSKARTLRLVILPQALRVIIPPMTSQYLNLTKNSSLAVAIGYPDIVSVVNTTLNQTGQAIEGILIIMAAYLTVSLSISIFMNWYNKRIALVDRLYECDSFCLPACSASSQQRGGLALVEPVLFAAEHSAHGVVDMAGGHERAVHARLAFLRRGLHLR